MSFPRYTARFSANAHLCRPTANQEKEIRASIDRLKGLLPSEINPEEHPTLLYVVGNLFVAGLLNKNDDGVSVEDGLKMYKAFEGQQINIEHNRSSVVGYIVKAGLSEFGTDRLITEDEARASGKPYNIAIAIALWKVVDKDLIKYILQATEPGSPMKDDLSLSFEVGFDEYKIVTLPKNVTNLAMATRTISASDDKFDRFDKKLRTNGGSGKEGNEHVGRVIEWPIIPLGGGIVAMPAAQVKGITPVLSSPKEEAEAEEATEANTGVSYKYSSTQCTLGTDDAAAFLAYSASIPDELLYTEEEGHGRENEPHITVYYGINGNDIAPVQMSVTGCGPIRAKLGKISAFVNEDKPYDVLKIDVESEDLHRLHALIKASCDCDELRPIYYPHLTLAYLKKGMSAQYVGDEQFMGMELTFSSLTFSPKDGPRQEINLAKEEAYTVASVQKEPPVVTPSLSAEALAKIQEEELLKSMEGKMVTLNAIDSEGKKVLIEMDAAEAWKETHQRIDLYKKILGWLKGD